jgi:thiamine pyrophosphate-dependent acetolactate synthase large subunit-like protein
MRVYDAMAAELVREGVRHAFGVMGEDTAKLILALDAAGVAYVGARHENQAVAMADGYARVSGQLGVVLLTSGAGFTNGLTVLNTASRARSPVLVFVGSRSARDDDPAFAATRTAKYFPHLDVCVLAGIAGVQLGESRTAMRGLRAAIRQARDGATVVVNVPADVLDARIAAPADADPRYEERSIPPVDAGQIGRVADFLQEASNVSAPLILAGKGAVLSDARGALERVGDALGALYVTTLPAVAFFAGDPWDLGISGSLATPTATALLARADCVLAFGASINYLTTFGDSLFPRARVIQVDADAKALGRLHPVEAELCIAGDAAATAAALADELERRSHSRTGFRTDAVRQELAARVEIPREAGTPGTVHPQTLMLELDGALPRERGVVIDGGHHLTFSAAHLRPSCPTNFILPLEAASIGVGVGEAIGASLALPGTPIVLAIGDGATMMALGDIETAARYGLPVVVVVCNDQALGAEAHYLDLIGQPIELAQHTTPAFADVAVAFGAEGHTITSIDDLERVCERLRRPITGPIVLDCRIDPAPRGEWVELLYLNAPGTPEVEPDPV